MERVVFYMRKSTEIQPWDRQRDVLEHYVASHANMLTVGEYNDVGSGMEVLPNMNKLLEDAKKGEFDTVLVSALNRLGRSSATLTRIFCELHNYGVNLVSVAEFTPMYD